MTHEIHQKKLALAKTLATLMDNAYEIPIIRKRIGLDAILGLIPGAGDVASFAVALYILFLARQLGMSRIRVTWMFLTVVLDTLLGALPILGDAFDAVFKANMRNVAAMERHMNRQYGLTCVNHGASRDISAQNVIVDVTAKTVQNKAK